MNCFICGREATKRRLYEGELRWMCDKHIAQLNFCKQITDPSAYSIQDKNEYVETEEGVWIICRAAKPKEHEETGRFLIDKEDFEKVIAHKWRAWKDDFFTGNFKPCNIARFIMNVDGFLNYVDHINGNRLDNRRSNLRVVTPSQNSVNKHIVKNVIAGVNFDESRNAYAVAIGFEGKRWRLSRWKNINDAVYCRYFAETIIFKEYRCTTRDNMLKPYIDSCERKEEIEAYVLSRIEKWKPTLLSKQKNIE